MDPSLSLGGSVQYRVQGAADARVYLETSYVSACVTDRSNVKHLANVNKRDHMARVCARCGCIAPEILTPDVFWEIES